jgi:hypothetical protein
VVPAGSPPAPIGTLGKMHSVDWFSIFGVKPRFNTIVVTTTPPAGSATCASPPGFLPVERVSAITTRFEFWGGSNTEPIGSMASSIPASCVLTNTLVEITDRAGNRLETPALFVDHPVQIWILFIPITLHQTATLTASPATGTGTAGVARNLSGTVRWTVDVGQEINYRLRYFLNQPPGTVCNP